MTEETKRQGNWTVYSTWRAIIDDFVPGELSQTFPDWPSARRAGRKASCLRGVRYVTVVDPEDVVVADYDRMTNYWREYALHIGPCDNYLERDDRPCDGQLYARPDDIQVRCPRCGAWTGTRGRGMRTPFDPEWLDSYWPRVRLTAGWDSSRGRTTL